MTTGIIGIDLYSVVVFMGLMTAIISIPFLKYALRRGGHALA